MALSDFLQNLGDDAPSGENLEYDPAFISLELAATPGEERQVGDEMIPAEEPDWKEVIAQATDVLGRSHDLRAAVFIAHAYLRTKGFPGFAEATGLIRGMVEDYWDTCHPQLDPDDDNDPTMRVNAVLGLCGPEGSPSAILRDVRYTPLTESRAFGRVTYRDVLIAQGEMTPPDGQDVLDASQISAAFSDTPAERALELRQGVEKAIADVKAIGAAFDDKAPSNTLDLKPMEQLLRQVLREFDNAGIGASEASEDGGDGDAGDGDDGGGGDGESAYRGGGGGGARGGSGGGSGGGAVNSQKDVRDAIDRIVAYYQRSEPSSPIPHLLQRAKRLVGADFVTIMKDVASDGTDQFYNIAGIKEEEDD